MSETMRQTTRPALFVPLIPLFLLALAPAGAHAQTVTVRGLVVDSASSGGIGSALVRIGERPGALTGIDGAFRLAGVPLGRHTLTVEATGYVARAIELEVRADTTLRIELVPNPMVLDTLFAEAREVTVSGEVRSAESGRRLRDVFIGIYPQGRTIEASIGRFEVDDVPAGAVTTFVFEAFEHLPTRLAVIPEADTSFTVEMELDPVVDRIITHQARRLQARAEAVDRPMRVIDREEILSEPVASVWDVLRVKFKEFGFPLTPPRVTDSRTQMTCLFLDDRRVQNLQRLGFMHPSEIQHIEVFGIKRQRRRPYQDAKIRIYTRRYAAELMGRQDIGELTDLRLGGQDCFITDEVGP